MGKPISLFSGYSQKENRTTNYCLLTLKMVYEENPKYFGEVLGGLIGYEISDYIGVHFRQQERRTSSVPDGLITQKPFYVYIETKNYDWFYDDQLEKHLDSLSRETIGLKILLALGNFEEDTTERFSKVKNLCEKKYRNSIVFAAVSFEDFVQAFSISALSKNLSDTVSELRSYLDEEKLLPTWQNWIDVINCAGLPEDVLKENVYICPAEGGSYSHSRCKYFGMYRDKRVELIALIKAIVDVESQSTARILWKNVKDTSTELINLANHKVKKLRSGEYPTRVFLLDTLYPTDFQKDSPGGMFGTKKYFDISRLNVESAEELSKVLRGRVWSEWQ